MTAQKRLEYIDFCKFIAMFVVTWGHFAQGFSHQIFPDFFGGHWYNIAFCMPLFMVCSGWFANPKKIRTKPIADFIKARFYRLVIPAVSFYLIGCIILGEIPNPLHAITLYWYLTSLFVCSVIIAVLGKYAKSMVSTYSLLVLVIFLPFSDFLKINFMLPFLMGGAFLKFVYSRIYSKRDYLFMATLTCVLTTYLLVFWDVNYSVYLAPYNSIKLDLADLGMFAYRYALGLWGSAFFILLSMKVVRVNIFKKVASLGKYTLVMYTVSIILKYFIQKQAYIVANDSYSLEIISFITTVIFIAFSVVLTKLLEKNRYLSFLFLGNKL